MALYPCAYKQYKWSGWFTNQYMQFRVENTVGGGEEGIEGEEIHSKHIICMYDILKQ